MLIYRLLNGIIKLALSLVLLIAGAYSVFALWDNARILSGTEELQKEILQWKPEIQEDSQHPGKVKISFDEIREINPDVCGWITMDGTHIDYPIVRGKSNIQYLNTDIYGESALSGSIFLDTRNQASFLDPYCLLYGHHMEEGNMFGDLDLYKDPEFLKTNHTGRLITPEGVFTLQIYGVLVVPVSDPVLFDPVQCGVHPENLSQYAGEHALQYLPERQGSQTLALSTCASEFQDARTVVLAAVEPWQGEEDRHA